MSNVPGLSEWNATPPVEEFDVRSILQFLRRRLGLIIVTFLMVLALAGLAILALKPVYTASALILVDPSHKNLLDPASTQDTSSDSARVDSEVALVRSPTTILNVVKSANLVTDPEFGVKLDLKDRVLAMLRLASPQLPSGQAALDSVVRNVLDAVSAQRQGTTYLISVDAHSASPDKAAMLANAVAKAYIDAQLNAKVTSILNARDAIQARVNDAQTTVANSEGAFDDYIAKNLASITTATGRTDLTQLRQQLDSLQADRQHRQEIADLVDKSMARQDWQAVAQSLQSEAVTALEKQREDLESALQTTAEGSPQTFDLKQQLDQVDGKLQTTTTAELTTMRLQVSANQAREADLRTQLRTAVLNSNLPPDILTSIYGLQQSAELARSQYQSLLARANDLNAQAYLQIADSRVVADATPPDQPSFPNPRLILALAGLFGLGLGLGLAVLSEHYVGGFISEGQLEALLKIPVVSAIARERGVRNDAQLASMIRTSPLSMFAESIRRLRVGVELSLRRVRPKDGASPSGSVIMVSSAVPSEGKSTLALLLARAFAMSGRRTVLIDCDLRKPRVLELLGGPPADAKSSPAGLVGVGQYLAMHENASSLADLLCQDPETDLKVALGVRHREIPADNLMTGQSLASLVHAATRDFEIVVLDTPPVGPVVDGIYLAQYADVIVFVVRWASTLQQEVRSAISSLASAKRRDAEIVGVLNQQDRSRATYRRKYAVYYET